MPEDQDRVRVWARLDELKEMMTRLLAVHGEREKNCQRNEACIASVKERVRLLEVGQAKWASLAAVGSAVLTAAAIKIFVR